MGDEKIQTEPSQVWEELSEDQRAYVRRLITYIAHEYVLARQGSRVEERKQSQLGNNSSPQSPHQQLSQD